ncbi:MAG: toxin glutamine deamidase domain-containing protein [Pseudomonadota bacterium]
MPLSQAAAARTTKLIARGNARGHRPTAPDPWAVWTNTNKGVEANDAAFKADPWGTMKKSLESEWAVAKSIVSGDADPTSHEGAVDGFIASAEGVVDAADQVAKAKGGLATFGAAVGVLTAIEQTLSVPFSMIPFPALPAVRVTDQAIGLPHAHMHPPNLIPPSPTPIPLPSAGPIIPIPFISGAGSVLINNLPAARCGDMGLGIWCGGYFPMYEIFLGSSSVWLEGARAARVAVDITKHCVFSTPRPSDPPLGPMVGATVSASPNVIIGGVPLPSLTGMAMGKAFKAVFKGFGKLKGLAKTADDVAEEAADTLVMKVDDIVDEAADTGVFNRADTLVDDLPDPPWMQGLRELDDMSRAVNPENGNVNCGKIIDAVLDRLTGRNSDAVAPRGRNGSWADIEARHNTQFRESSFDDAFREVQNGGDGTKALVGIHYPDGDCHVVVLTNNKGSVGIVEGQGGGAVHTHPDSAKAVYGHESRVTKADL